MKETPENLALWEKLARWLVSSRKLGWLPEPPFKLRLGCTIIGERFYDRLEFDVRQGLKGPRNRYGAVMTDLKDLVRITRRKLNEGNPKAGWCPGCCRPCPGVDPQTGFCLDANMDEIRERMESAR